MHDLYSVDPTNSFCVGGVQYIYQNIKIYDDSLVCSPALRWSYWYWSIPDMVLEGSATCQHSTTSPFVKMNSPFVRSHIYYLPLSGPHSTECLIYLVKHGIALIINPLSPCDLVDVQVYPEVDSTDSFFRRQFTNWHTTHCCLVVSCFCYCLQGFSRYFHLAQVMWSNFTLLCRMVWYLSMLIFILAGNAAAALAAPTWDLGCHGHDGLGSTASHLLQRTSRMLRLGELSLGAGNHGNTDDSLQEVWILISRCTAQQIAFFFWFVFPHVRSAISSMSVMGSTAQVALGTEELLFATLKNSKDKM